MVSTYYNIPFWHFSRSLKVLSIDDSDVEDKGGDWLQALAQNNSVLEVLNFAILGLEDIDIDDMALLVEKCKSLVSLKVGEVEMVDMVGVLSKAHSLRELGAGSCNELGDEESGMTVTISLPSQLTALSGLWAMGDVGLTMVMPIAPNLRKLDLKFTLLSSKGHCQLLSHCHALQELQVQSIKQVILELM
jgi:coronatine-insensitive protein 1